MADDGIGIRLVEEIEKRGICRDFSAVELADDGLKLLDYFTTETKKILLIDCIKSDLAPGEYFFFSPEDVESRKYLARMSTHEGDILKVIELGKALGYPIPPMRVLAITPECIEPKMELSETLAKRFEEYLQVAVKEITTEVAS